MEEANFMSKKVLDSNIFARLSPNSSIVPYHGVRPTHGHGLFMACGARLIGQCHLGMRVSLWFGAIVRGDVNAISIGDETNIQDGAVIHGTYEKFSTHIGSRVSIGHNAIVHGATIEDRVLIGMGAVIMDGARVGAGSVIGAGAIVRQGQEIPPNSLVVGAPASVKRRLSEDESLQFTAAFERYLFYVLGYDYPDTLR